VPSDGSLRELEVPQHSDPSRPAPRFLAAFEAAGREVALITRGTGAGDFEGYRDGTRLPDREGSRFQPFDPGIPEGGEGALGTILIPGSDN